MLAVNDDCCRENLCLMADYQHLSGRVATRVRCSLLRVMEKPACIVSDKRHRVSHSRAIPEVAGISDVELALYSIRAKRSRNASSKASTAASRELLTRRIFDTLE